MKTELFKKVYIHSEKDLPKEAGFYFLHWKHTNDRMHTQMGVQYYDESIKGLWFGKGWYDWYLLPVSIPSDEEIEKWAEEESKVEIEEDGEVKTYSTCISEFYIEGAKWMRDELTAK